MRIKQDGTRYLQDRNCQTFAVQILQLPTAADVVAKYANLSGFALDDFTRWRKEYSAYLDLKFLDDVLSALAAFAAYLKDVDPVLTDSGLREVSR